MKKNIIVLIGGPGTGKTTLIEGLQAKGFCCYPEISREITLEAQKNGIEQLFLEQPLLFSELLLKGRTQQFENALEESHNHVFIDRGLPDVLAYLDYLNQEYPLEYQDFCVNYTYNQVFVLPPWEEIYVSDQARYEDFDQAQKIHTHIVATYQKWGYTPIEIPKDTLENRIDFIMKKMI
ncbi:MAG: hypothetical protein QG594_937 [Bacteroidota bacterium]|nr:hypothetical protein [Bacteroidota bacterium]